MRTERFRAVGSDGKHYLVFRRTPTVEGHAGTRSRRPRPARFYLDNGDPLERTIDPEVLRSDDGSLTLRIQKEPLQPKEPLAN